MTFKELMEWLETLTPEQLECNVSVYFEDEDEYYPLSTGDITVESNVLDEDHPVLVV